MGRSGARADAPATLRDVAAAAGVSIRTVSNVVTGAVPVRPETRDRVRAAVDALGYRPNVAARRLRSGRAQAIGLVLPDVTVPYFREFADEVLAAARAAGFAVVVEQTGGVAEREHAALTAGRLRHVDGIVLTAVALGAEDLDDLRDLPTRPVVLAGAGPVDGRLDVVAPDQYAAGHAVGELIGRTARRPVVLAADDPAWLVRSSERYRGYVDGLRVGGVDADPDRVVRAQDVTLEAGRAAVPVLLDRHPDVDAVFANADALALGVLRGLRDAGRSVPSEVEVVGFGNVEHAAHSRPPLTTVDTARAEAARAAVRTLVDRLEGTLPSSPVRIDSGFALVERGSTRGG